MLLASSLPFYGRDRQEVAKLILMNQYGFKGKRWKRVSSEAKAFIKSLLVAEPDDRLDAETALGSAWLNMFLHDASGNARRAPRPEEEEMAKKSMLRYADYPKLKKMVRRK